MLKEIMGTIMTNLFKSSFNLHIKNKGDLKIQRCHLNIMTKTKKISFSLALAVS